MSLLSHGAEPSRWETHHILIPALKDLVGKAFHRLGPSFEHLAEAGPGAKPGRQVQRLAGLCPALFAVDLATHSSRGIGPQQQRCFQPCPGRLTTRPGLSAFCPTAWGGLL